MGRVFEIVLLGILLAAVWQDLRTGCIPNRWIAAGLLAGIVFQLMQNGTMGFVLFLGGALLPLLLLGVLFYFRMLGAGDIKLFCVVGGFLGGFAVMRCMAMAAVIGAIWSAWRLWKGHAWRERFGYFMQYAAVYAKERQWNSYLAGVNSSGRFCFSLPILASVLCYMGGWI